MSDEISTNTPEEGDIQCVLKDIYGIEYFHETLTEDELKRRGYRKATPNEVTKLSTIFRYAPQIIADKATTLNTQESFKKAINDSFRVKIDIGTHLASSKNTPGAFRALEMDDITNKLKGQVELFKNDAVLEVSRVPQIAMGVFNAASFATGQYFMSEINGKLTNIQENLSRVEHYLEAIQRSKLHASIDELEEIAKRAELIERSESRINQCCEQLHAIQRTARETIRFCQEKIFYEKSTAKDNDKETQVRSKIHQLTSYMVQYFYAVEIYCSSKLFEMTINHLCTDVDELDYLKDELEKSVNGYKKTLNSLKSWIPKYINTNHALNNKSFGQWAAIVGTGALSVFAMGTPYTFTTGVRSVRLVDNAFEENRLERKNRQSEQAAKSLKRLSEVESGVLQILCKPVKAV